VAAKTGERAAFAAMLGKIERIVKRILMGRRRSFPQGFSVDWDVLKQEAWLRSMLGLSSFRGTNEAQLVSWIKRIIEHLVQDALRQLGTEHPEDRMVLSLEEARAVTCPDLDPSDVASVRELLARVGTALARLPEKLRRVIEIRTVDGAGFAEVARKLRLPGADAARLCFHRAIARLRNVLIGADKDAD
jgi:RNA polymerase sigma factor (sigma-70 family)